MFLGGTAVQHVFKKRTDIITLMLYYGLELSDIDEGMNIFTLYWSFLRILQYLQNLNCFTNPKNMYFFRELYKAPEERRSEKHF